MREMFQSKLATYATAASLLLFGGLAGVQEVDGATNTFLGTYQYLPTSWSNIYNWSLGATPVATDDVVINYVYGTATPAYVLYKGTKYPTTSPTVSSTINSLTISSGAEINGAYSSLIVSNTTSMNDATISLYNFTTGTLDMQNESVLNLRNSAAINGSATIGSSSDGAGQKCIVNIDGDMTINLGSSATTFVNNGVINVDNDLTLTADAGSYDLGGDSGSGTVNIANNTTLTLDAYSSVFDGTLTMGGGAEFYNAASWTATGTLTLANSIISGGTLTLTTYADMYTSGDNTEIDTDLIVNGFASIDASDTITYLGDVVLNTSREMIVEEAYFEGDFTMSAGTLEGDDVYLNGDTTISDGTVDIDNFIVANNAEVTIGSDVTFVLNDMDVESGTVSITRNNFDDSDDEFGAIKVYEGSTLNLITDDEDGVQMPGTIYMSGPLNATTTSAVPTLLEIDGNLQLDTSSASVSASELSVDGAIIINDNGIDMDVSKITTDRLYVNYDTPEAIGADITIRSKVGPTTEIGLSLHGDLQLNGTGLIGKYNRILVYPDSELIVNDSLTILEGSGMLGDATGDGTLTATANGTLNISGQGVVLRVDVNNYGTLSVINDWNDDNRTLTIGASTRQKTYTQYSSGTLQLDIAGSDDDVNNYDDIDVYGDVVLDGELAIDMGSFAPSISISDPDVYEVLTWTGTLTGSFASASGLISDDDTAMLELVYNANSLELVTWLAGDLDHDGFVGLDDLDIILDVANWNMTVGVTNHARGDATGDGYVGLDDIDAVMNNWNTYAPPVSGASVPEPASLVLVGLGGLAMLRRGKH